MNYRFRLEYSSNYGLFIKQELKMKRVSYDSITPSTVRGIIEVIYLVLSIIMLTQG